MNDFYDFVVERLKRYEGWRNTPYHDAKGILTVGYGHNLESQPLPELKYPITENEGVLILHRDLSRIETILERIWPYYYEHGPARRAALLDMAYNMGPQKLVFGWPNFLEAMRTGHYESAALLIDKSEYRKEVHQRAVDNAELIRSGVIPS